MKLYNTLTRTIEEFIPNNKELVTMYTCGPTVYHYAHIGNLRCYIMEDILEKSLNYVGYNVKRAMNITDVGHLSSDADTGDDKMVKAATKEHKSVMDIAKFYTDAFFKDCEYLNIKKPEIVSEATSNIADYIEKIKFLVEKDYAYIADGNVYFDTSKLKEYYVLTNHNENDLMVGVRDDVEEDLNKKNKNDFVLWFTKSKFSDQDLKWVSPWGLGYPGWHIECSCISMKYLGEYLDIHCGGVDNIFPHHTNEIAQSESILNHKWCSYWFHVEHLNDKNGKMSKSKGGSLTVSTLIENGYDPIVFRFMCLNSHYRNQLVFSYEALDTFVNSYKKLKDKIKNLNDKENFDEIKFKEYDDKFKETLNDDLNTSNSMTLIYDVLKSDVSDSTKIALLKSWDKVLSLNLFKSEEIKQVENEEYILNKIAERKEAKENKDYAKADAIREELLKVKIELIDTRDGTTYKVMEN